MLTADLPNASFASDSPSIAEFTLKTGSFTVRTLPVEIGELSENMSLSSRRRLHTTEDSSELMFETVNTIPFGTEPQIQRKIKISEGLICFTSDIVMRGTELTELSGGGAVISGNIQNYGLILPPRKGCVPDTPEMKSFTEISPDGGILFDEAYPPLGLVLESDQERFDWAPGDDLWRWSNAERIGGGKARFTIKREKDAVRMQWKLFEKLPKQGEEEIPVPGRNWRLTWAMAWKPLSSKRAKKPVQVFDAAAFDWPDSALGIATLKKNAAGERGCFCSATTLNILKKWLRTRLEQAEEGTVFEIAGIQPQYCVNASHVDRAKYKSLPHWDLMSVIEFRRWAGRQLARKNASIKISAPKKSPWRGFMILN